MKDETKTGKEKKEKLRDRKRLYSSVTAILVVAALIAGISYAWLVNHNSMATLMEIKSPADITILGPGGSELKSLDLNYEATDVTTDAAGNKKVTVRRVICVQSAFENFRLEIVHTTNLKGLEFSLYPVSTGGTANVTDGGYSYSYNLGEKIPGKYLNAETSNSEYQYANKSKHSLNYDDYSNVQSHAEPVYWLTDQVLEADTAPGNSVEIEGKTNYRTYYVCEVSWTETTKETDIFYILAKTESKSES